MRLPALLLATATLALGPSAVSPCAAGAAQAQGQGYGCCKTCRAGKACGDSCIARDKVCHKGKGCACDG